MELACAEQNVLNVMNRPSLISLLAVTVGLSLLPASSRASEADPSAAAAWNQWRGPNRDGTVAGSDWPEDLSGLELLWRIDLGKGYSGPLVVGDWVYVTESADRDTEAVRALSRTDGKTVWSLSWPGRGRVPFFAARNGDWIRATPLHDGEAIYVGGMQEVLIKLDAETGKEIWRVDFPARFGTAIPEFGFVSSPLIDGDALFVQAANSIVKLDRHSGKTLWRQLQNSGDIYSSGAFSSPVVTDLAGRRQLLVQTREILYGLDPAAGDVLWEQPVPSFRGMNILTPVIHGNSVLTSTHRHGTYLFRISGAGEQYESRQIWQNKVQGYMSSPVVVDGHAYLHLGNGRLACLDLASGTESWISKPFGKYWSLAVQQEKLLALDAGGELFLLRANPRELEVLDSRQIAAQSTWGHLAVSGNEIFVRELEAVTAYRWTDESESDQVTARASMKMQQRPYAPAD